MIARALISALGIITVVNQVAIGQCVSSGDDTHDTLYGGQPVEQFFFTGLCPAASDVHITLSVTADLGCHPDDQDDCNTENPPPGDSTYCNVQPTSKYITLRIGPPDATVPIDRDNTNPDPATQLCAGRPWLDVPENGHFFEAWVEETDIYELEFGRSWCSGENACGSEGGGINVHKFYIPKDIWNGWLGGGDTMEFRVTITSVSKELTDYCDSELGGVNCNTTSVTSSSEIKFAYTPSGSCCDGNECNTTSEAECEGAWILGGVCNTADCDTDGLIDMCEGEFADCDTNGQFDICDAGFEDCNTNDIYDLCDLAAGMQYAERLYWTEDMITGNESVGNTVERIDLEAPGTAISMYDWIDGVVRRPAGIALDVMGAKMYWTEWGGVRRIRRSNLDGTDTPVDLSTGLAQPYDIALDLAHGKMYWADAGDHTIRRKNIDGSGDTDLLWTMMGESPAGPHGVALDVANNAMYWTHGRDRVIYRADLNGNGAEPFTTTGMNSKPIGIALDLVHRRCTGLST